jgi:hypothetical protein
MIYLFYAFKIIVQEILSYFILFIIRYELIYNKGYQSVDSLSSVLTTKVKGTGFLPIDSKISLNKINELDYLKDLFVLKQNIDYKVMDIFGSF